MSEQITQEKLDRISSVLGSKLQDILESEGLSEFEIEQIILKQKADAGIMGLLPGCSLECTIGGFPPRITCKVKCG